MAVTGVQRYARELTERLPNVLREDVALIVPGRPLRFLTGAIGRSLCEATGGWSGVRGHAWEQLVLPLRFYSSGSELLVNLANWAPVALKNQIVAILDLAPLRLPGYFSARYRRFVDIFQRRAARAARRVVTLSEETRLDISREFGIAQERIDIVPPGLGSPFSDTPKKAGSSKGMHDYCLFVGGHDPRKNLKFLTGFWSEVYEASGLRLVVVERSQSRPHAQAIARTQPGTEFCYDPTDAELIQLYDNALCLLSPSIYEGYGLPLLEAMARGTPFISSDTGAARELAAEPERQVLPLKADRWIEVIDEWRASFPLELTTRLEASVVNCSWERSALQLAESIDRALRS